MNFELQVTVARSDLQTSFFDAAGGCVGRLRWLELPTRLLSYVLLSFKEVIFSQSLNRLVYFDEAIHRLLKCVRRVTSINTITKKNHLENSKY